ncbi:MAG: hypothetical protein R2838_11250 [Caldilineaceae bacterium]
MQALLWLFVPALLSGLLGAPLGSLLSSLAPVLAPVSGRAANFTLTLLGVLGGTWLATRFLDRRDFRDLGLHFSRAWWIDFAFGLGLGALLMTLIFAVEWLMGWIDVTGAFEVADGTPFLVAILGPVIVFIVVGTAKNYGPGLKSRIWRKASTGKFLTPAPGCGGNLSCSLSLFRPAAYVQSQRHVVHCPQPDGGGCLSGDGLRVDRQSMRYIGLHITWNFFQGNVFGFPVSGNDFTTVTFIAIRQGGPDLWTGGPFGPEAGLLGIVAMVLGSLLTVVWIQRRHGDIRIDTALARYRPRRRSKQ